MAEGGRLEPAATCGQYWGSPVRGSQTCVRLPLHDGKHRDSAGREWARRRDMKTAQARDRQEASRA